MLEMNTFLEQNVVQLNAVKSILPKTEKDNTPIIIAVVQRFGQEMRDVLNENSGATPEEIVWRVGEMEHKDPRVIVEETIEDDKKRTD